ncbi:30S ribosomal protein S1 [Desulfogranum japonicum]|uniref:30S ribosomal protein S1 n=1 Tax=Desulfogranum japonicum TaxID=231447 RepID=UPI00041DCB09|nr:30S ribosomal protein S1 [Desulfogranum japonicum]
MSDDKFADLFQETPIDGPKLKPGDKVKAVIAEISGENVFLDIGAKSEGVINKAELVDEEGNMQYAPGESIQVFLLSNRGGELLFTTRIGSGQASLQEVEDAFQSGIPVQGKVTGEIKGGFSVDVAGSRAFCPYSQMDIRRIERPEDYLEQTLAFRVIEFGNRGRNIILSARVLLEEQRAEEREKLRESLEEGMQASGTVTAIRNFGAFVDIGGIDGLIPISELAWGQTDKVEDVLQLGQQVEVIIKRLDWENDKISLSLKETLPNPWDKVEENYPVGSTHIATVSRLVPFGAFVTLESGIDGLLHISKLGSGRKINHPREVLEAGQEITVRIDSIDTDQQRISLVPDDYQEKSEEKSYTPPPAAEKETRSMGTLGDLLKAQLNRNK